MPVESASHRKATVSKVLADQDWRLSDADELLAAIEMAADEDETAQALRRCTVHEYSKVLYLACSQAKDITRRERAYHELHRYLYRAVYNRWPQLAEDITQQAILIVAEQLDRCRHPGTFLSFALFKTRDAMKRVLRDEDRWRTQTAPLLTDIPLPSTTSPVARVIVAEEMAAVRTAILQLSVRQQQVLLLKYEEGLDDGAIAADLSISVNHVRVLRNRARKRLRMLLAY